MATFVSGSRHAAARAIAAAKRSSAAARATALGPVGRPGQPAGREGAPAAQAVRAHGGDGACRTAQGTRSATAVSSAAVTSSARHDGGARVGRGRPEDQRELRGGQRRRQGQAQREPRGGGRFTGRPARPPSASPYAVHRAANTADAMAA